MFIPLVQQNSKTFILSKITGVIFMAGQAVNTLLLSQKDLIDLGVMNMGECIDVIEGVFSLIGKGDYLMGGPLENEHGQMIYFPETERFSGDAGYRTGPPLHVHDRLSRRQI